MLLRVTNMQLSLGCAPALFGFALLCASPVAHSAILLQQFSAPITITRDTNPLMEQGNATALWKATLNPHYYIQRVQDLDQWTADLMLRIERSTDRSIILDREDPSVGLGWRREFERGQVGVRLGYDEASSRSSSLDELGRTIGGDSTRVSKSIGMDGQYLLTEKLSLSANANATRMTFRVDGGGSSGGGTRTYATSVSLNYLYTERLQPYLQFTANRSAPDGSRIPATNVYGTVAGVKWQPSDQLNVGVYGGVNQVTGVTSARGWQGGANLGYTFEKSNLTMVMTRSISPSGNGGFISSDQLTGAWSYTVSEYSRAGADLSIRRSLGITSDEYRTFSTWYAHDLNPDWSLRLSYQYKESKRTDFKAQGNVFSLSLAYNFSEF